MGLFLKTLNVYYLKSYNVMLIQPNAGDWMPSTEKWLSRLQSTSGPASLSNFNSLEIQSNQPFSSSKAWTNASERIGAANIFHSSLNKKIGLYVLRMPMRRASFEDESMVLCLIQARAPKVGGPLHLMEI